MIYWIGFAIVKLLDKIYFTAEYIGLENLPAKGSFILACNHISNLDPFIVGTCVRRRFHFIAKDSLFKNKFFGFILSKFGAIPIKRNTSDFHAIREVLRRLKKNSPLVLFPEGTRRVSGRDKKIQGVVGLIALKAHVPVFPVHIEGSQKALPPGEKWFMRHPVTVTFGRPIHFNDSDSYIEVAERIMNEVYKLQ